MNQVELVVKANIYNSKKSLIRKNASRRIYIDVLDIKNPREVFNTKGNIVKGECELHIKDLGDLIVNHSYEYIKKIKEEKQNNKIGFEYGKNTSNKRKS